MTDFVYLIKEYIGLLNQFAICFILSKQNLKLSPFKLIAVSACFFIIEFICLKIFSNPLLSLCSIAIGLYIYNFLNNSKSTFILNSSTFILAVIIEAMIELFIEYTSLFGHHLILKNILIKLFILVTVLIIILIQKIFKMNNEAYNQIYLNLFLCIGFFVGLMIFLIVGLFGDKLIGATSIFLIVLAVLAIISDILIYYFYIRSEKQNINARETIQMKNEMIRLQQQRYNDMVESYSKIKKFRHDSKGYIATIQQFILNEDYSSLNKMVNDIDILLKNTDIVSCNNPNIGAIVNYFYNVFKRENIIFEFDYRVIAYVNMSSEHICSLFYNLLENAKEASMKAQDKNVKLMIKSKDRALIISLQNKINKKDFCLSALENRMTTKNDKSNHGIGLINIDTVVNTYNGQIEYEQKEDILHTTIILLDVIIK